jgi:glutamine synthetase type III
MQLTIDVKDSVVDKIMYLLDNLKADVKIIRKTDTQLIEEVSDKEQNYYENVLHNMSEDDKIISSKESVEI